MRKFVVIVAGCFLCCGCGEAKVTRPTAPVSGKLTFTGKPLERGEVIFFHDQGESSSGVIGPDGKYSLTATVGPNKIMVRSHAANCACTYCTDAANLAEQAKAASSGKDVAQLKKAQAMGRGSGMFIPTYFVPERYENHMSSGLSYDVKAGTENTADFDLSK